jgi:uroporphyrinogen-III decarboxylase
MNSKERMVAALGGKPTDQVPVVVPYIQLYHQDHFAELTGRPGWHVWKWMFSDPQEHVQVLKSFQDQVDFDLVQPQPAPTAKARACTEFIEIDGQPYRKNLTSGQVTSLNTVSGHILDDVVNQQQYIFSIQDAHEKIKLKKSADLFQSGIMDYALEAKSALGNENFILTGGVVGAWYGCVEHLGLLNLFAIAAENPSLVDTLCQLNLEQNIEMIHCAARVGGDAIYIDDATMTSEMVSPGYYERFSLPYTRAMIDEIHRCGHKAILIYFGGVMDRLDLIAECNADGLIVETSMKGYANDIEAIVTRIGNKVTVFGNLDPIGVLEKGSDEMLEREIKKQLAAGKKGRGFVLSTGSPITPGTRVARVKEYLRLGRNLSLQ